MKILIVSIALVTLVLTMSTGALADPPSWDSFLEATFDDVFLSPALTSGTLNYVLSVGAAPKIAFGGNTYDIWMIGGFFAVSGLEATTFSSTGVNGAIVSGVNNVGNWESKPVATAPISNMAGWMVNGNTDWIKPGAGNINSWSISFDSLTWEGNIGPLMGLHVGYGAATAGLTSFFKDTGGGIPHEPVPEASTLIGFGSALAMVSPGIAGWLRRRKI